MNNYNTLHNQPKPPRRQQQQHHRRSHNDTNPFVEQPLGALASGSAMRHIVEVEEPLLHDTDDAAPHPGYVAHVAAEPQDSECIFP